MGGLEVAASPMSQGQEARRRPATERIIVAREVEGPEGEHLGALAATCELRLGGSVQRDRARQPRERGFVEHHDRPRWVLLPDTRVGGWLEPPLCSLQQSLNI